MPFVVCCDPFILIGHVVADGVVEQDGDLAGGRRHRFLLSDSRREAAIEGAARAVSLSPIVVAATRNRISHTQKI